MIDGRMPKLFPISLRPGWMIPVFQLEGFTFFSGPIAELKVA